MPLDEVTFITGNSNKLAEVQAMLGDFVTVKSHSVDLIEIQGTAAEICRDKCGRAAAVVLC